MFEVYSPHMGKRQMDSPEADSRQLRATIGFLLVGTAAAVLDELSLVGARVLVHVVALLVIAAGGLFLLRSGRIGVRYRVAQPQGQS
jgi:hypothetical protein